MEGSRRSRGDAPWRGERTEQRRPLLRQDSAMGRSPPPSPAADRGPAATDRARRCPAWSRARGEEELRQWRRRWCAMEESRWSRGGAPWRRADGAGVMRRGGEAGCCAHHRQGCAMEAADGAEDGDETGSCRLLCRVGSVKARASMRWRWAGWAKLQPM